MKAKRINSNSESLKKTFPQVYADLFSRSSLVVSSPGSFWWTGEYATENGGVAILQKLPIRSYVGIEPTMPGVVKIGTYMFYVPSKRKFQPSMIEDPVATKYLTFLKELPEIQKTGIILHIIQEIPPGCGLNTSGTVSSGLATALGLFFGKVSISQIENWNFLSSNQLIKDKKFDQTFRLAWKLESIPHADAATGATVFGQFLPGSYPVVYWTNPQPWDLARNSWQSRYKFVDEYKYWGARLNELFHLAPQPLWPVDFALIYCGESRSTSLAASSVKENLAELAEIRHRLGEVERQLDGVKFVPAVFDMVKSFKKSKMPDHFSDILTNPIALNSLEILFGFKEIFEKGLSEQALRSFFKHINRNQDLLSALGLSSPIIDHICQQLKSEVKELGDDYGAAAKTTGGGIKGDILFTVVYHGLRDQIDRIISESAKQTGETIFLDYASWLDGIEDEGIKVEQDLSAKIYSEFISEGAILVNHITNRSTHHKDLYTLEEFRKKIASIDLTIDMPKQTIYIKGEEIMSKELPSSKAATLVLSKLFDKLGKEVKNTVFGNSSYFVDRNEFQSKIITPLVKVIKKKLGKDFPIEIHGGLDTFTVKLTEPPFHTYLVEKTF